MVMCVNVDVAMYQTLVATVIGADDVMVMWIMCHMIGISDTTNCGDVSLVTGQVLVTAVIMCH